MIGVRHYDSEQLVSLAIRSMAVPDKNKGSAIVNFWETQLLITREFSSLSLCYQNINTYLKELSGTCGIHKKLSFHCARHTFTTSVTLSNGVPIESVSKMLGHINLRTTQIQIFEGVGSKSERGYEGIENKAIQ